MSCPLFAHAICFTPMRLTRSVVDECLCLHAEENALLEAGRERIGEDSVIYCNTSVLPLMLQPGGRHVG